jgi:hypothetical protein
MQEKIQKKYSKSGINKNKHGSELIKQKSKKV